MKNIGIKLVKQDKLFSKIFLPKPTLFQVVNMESITGVEGVYSIPVYQWYKH